MKAKDLRIGNLVYYRVQDELDDRKEWDEINVVDAEDILYIEACELNGWKHGYSLIPLTQDRMTELGFQSIGVWSDANSLSGLVVRSDQRYDGFKIIKDYYFQYGENKVKIEYVHQLQNINFALTSIELEYKPMKKIKSNG